MIVSLFVFLFIFDVSANGGGYGSFDANDPPIDFLVSHYSNNTTGTAQEFLEKVFSKAQLELGSGKYTQSYNLTPEHQNEFMRKYLTRISMQTGQRASTTFQDEVKKLAKTTYATDINYNLIDKVTKLRSEGVKGVELYEKLIDEEFNMDDIKVLLNEEVKAANSFSGWGESVRDELLKFTLDNNLMDDEFVTMQFENLLSSEGMRTSQFGIMQHESMQSKYSDNLKKLAKMYDPNTKHQVYGGNLLCRTLSWTSLSMDSTPEMIATQEVRDKNIIYSFNNLSRVVRALSDFKKDVTNNNELCFGEKSLVEYIEEFQSHPLFDHDDPNLRDWINTVTRGQLKAGCGENKALSVIPNSLCKRDILLEEATQYLKTIKRVNKSVEHVYAHQINNCLLLLFANLTSTDSQNLSTDDFQMEIKYLSPHGEDKIVDEVKETRNFRFFQIEMEKKRDFILNSIAK
jgi:hypothetical protein